MANITFQEIVLILDLESIMATIGTRVLQTNMKSISQLFKKLRKERIFATKHGEQLEKLDSMYKL